MTYKLIEKAKELARNPTACNWFQFFAQETWDRIGYVRTRRGLKIWETTVTQNLMFEFHTSKEAYLPMMRATWGIEILESVNESTNGNDIELFVETSGGILFFAIQAKIINHDGFRRGGLVDGNYPYMNHTVGTNNQIDLLCDYASKKGGLPLYLLYNYVNDNYKENMLCGIDYEIEQYGCSIVNASYIKNNYLVGGVWTIPTFKNLHPNIALPWFTIPCCFSNKSKDEVLKMLGFESKSIDGLTNYSLDEIRNDKDWKYMRPFNEIKKEEIISEDDNKTESNLKDSIEFKPRYRIMVSPKLSVQKEIKPF